MQNAFMRRCFDIEKIEGFGEKNYVSLKLNVGEN
jgi:hypothetical protein